MKVAICYNLKKKGGSYLSAEYDTPYTVEAIQKALLSRGAKTLLVEADEDAFSRFKEQRSDIDLVFNIAEGIRGESRESHIPAILEFLKIHYTGPGVECSAICLDKALTKRVLRLHGIPTAPWVVISRKQTDGLEDLKPPLIIKPLHEGSSIGIDGISLKNNFCDALKRAEEIQREFDQPALVEEYLPGPEITVGILGNRKPKVLPLLEIYAEMYPGKTKRLVTKDAKTVLENDAFSGKPRRVSPEKQRRIKQIALKTYQILGCRDFARVDIRFDRKGVPCVMEVNPIPGINPKVEDVSYFTKMCRMAKISYEDMIWKIVEVAMDRKKKENESCTYLQFDKT